MTTTFKKMTTLDDNIIMIPDALNLAFRYKHSGAKNWSEDYLRTIDSLRKSYKAGKVILACDEGSSSYRKEIFPDYKSARKEKYKDQTEQERIDFEEFFEEFNLAIDTVKLEGYYPVLKFPGVEADDIAAYIVNKRKKSNTIWLMSSDKDWDLLINSTVSRFSYITRKEITESNWDEHYDYDIDKHLSIKCLTGDSGDSIPGVEGVGPKRAIQLLNEWDSIYDIIASLPIPGRYKYISNLNTFGEQGLTRNYRLMDLVSYCEEAIGEDNCKEIDKIIGEYLD